jgi:hypothetical protein
VSEIEVEPLLLGVADEVAGGGEGAMIAVAHVLQDDLALVA